MHSFELIHTPVTDLSFSDYFYLDLSELGVDSENLFKLPEEKAWVQVDLPSDVSLPDGFGAFEKRLIFIQKKPELESISETIPIEDILEIRHLLTEQQAYHYQLDAEYFASLKDFRIDAYLNEIQEKLNDGSAAAFGIRENGMWFGFAVLEKEDDSAYLLELMVVEEARGKGYGKVLVAASENWAAEQHFTRLWTSVSAQNDSAFAFYQKLGFKTFKERYALYRRL